MKINNLRNGHVVPTVLNITQEALALKQIKKTIKIQKKTGPYNKKVPPL